MKNMRYDFDFILPDKTVITYTGKRCAEAVELIIQLAKDKYDVDYKFTKYTLYNLTIRPEKAHSFFKNKLRIRKVFINEAVAATTIPTQAYSDN